jgi:hypothetical protein
LAAMKGLALGLWLLAACSSRERATPAKGSAAPSKAAVARAALDWQPLEIEGQPVQQLHAVPSRSDGKLVYMGGTAITASGTYDLFWKLDKLSAVPGVGRRSLPHGSWLTHVESQGEKFVLMLGTSDAAGTHLSTFHTADEPIEVIAQVGELRFRVLVFREGERWRIARSTDEGAHWKTDTLPMKGAGVASAVDPEGREVALAWNDGENGRWLQIRDESAEARKLEGKPLPGTMTNNCSSDYLWVATTKNTVQRLPYGEVHAFDSAPTIVACNADNVLVKLADGSAKLCSFECKPAKIPAGEPSVQALFDEDLVMVEQRDGGLAITRKGVRTEYDEGGVIQRMQLLDFDRTPVLVAYGREGLDPTRFAIIP